MQRVGCEWPNTSTSITFPTVKKWTPASGCKINFYAGCMQGLQQDLHASKETSQNKPQYILGDTIGFSDQSNVSLPREQARNYRVQAPGVMFHPHHTTHSVWKAFLAVASWQLSFFLPVDPHRRIWNATQLSAPYGTDVCFNQNIQHGTL